MQSDKDNDSTVKQIETISKESRLTLYYVALSMGLLDSSDDSSEDDGGVEESK